MNYSKLSLGNPIWNTGAARRSRLLRRGCPRDACAVRADAKLGSSTTDRFWEIAERLELSNFLGNFTGILETFLFRLLGEERNLLGPVGARRGEASGTYSMHPSSTTSENCNPGLDAV